MADFLNIVHSLLSEALFWKQWFFAFSGKRQLSKHTCEISLVKITQWVSHSETLTKPGPFSPCSTTVIQNVNKAQVKIRAKKDNVAGNFPTL